MAISDAFSPKITIDADEYRGLVESELYLGMLMEHIYSKCSLIHYGEGDEKQYSLVFSVDDELMQAISPNRYASKIRELKRKEAEKKAEVENEELREVPDRN